MRIALLLSSLGLIAASACRIDEPLYVLPGDDIDGGPDDFDARPDDFDAEPAPDADPASLDCTEPLPCPAASANKVTVCGSLFDVENDAPIRAVTVPTGACGVGGVSGGACDVQIRFFDALDYTNIPGTAVPLPVAEMLFDDCGRFVARDIDRPSLGYLGIVTDDAPSTADLRRPTLRVIPVASAQIIFGEHVYAVRATTDQAWSNSAGLTGATFVERGVLWKLFLRAGNPVAGVTITVSGLTRAADDYYFSNAQPFSRTTVAVAQTVTGANGSGLVLNSALVDHSGSGGEVNLCSWPDELAASISGVLFVAPTSMIITADGEPCP